MKKNLLQKNFSLTLGSLFLFLLLFCATFAPLLTHYSPTEISLPNELCKPSPTHILGCDSNGTDIFSILLFGSRISLLVGLVSTSVCLCIALVLGSIAGFFGGKVDSLLMRGLDMIFAFPGILLAITVSCLLKPSVWNLILCLCATGWAGYTRLVRGEVRNIMTKEFIESARALGASPVRIIVLHIWPNILSTIVVAASFGLAGTILAEASLSFLGIGVPAGTPSWGTLLSSGKDVIIEAPHVASFPGIAIALTVLCFNFLGEGLRKKFDPKAY